jgi:site-specific recombinase XerD
MESLGLSPCTRRQRILRLRTFYESLILKSVCKFNPVCLEIAPKVRDTRCPKAPSLKELQSIAAQIDLSSFQGLQTAVMISLMVYEALRIGEVASLRRGALREIDNKFHLEVQGKGNHLCTVVVWPQTASILKKYLQKGFFESRKSPLFYSPQNPAVALTDRTIRRRVSEIFEKAGLPKGLSAHSLRHFSASYLASQGVPLATIQQHLRHRHLETTYRYLQNIPGMPETSLAELPKKMELNLGIKKQKGSR